MHYSRLLRIGEVGEVETRRKNYDSSGVNWKDPKQVKKYYRERAREWRKENGSLKSIGSMHKMRFGGLRILVLKRDGYECQICEMTDKEHREKWDREITVDHIDGSGRYHEISNNSMDNLWTLCLHCHSKRDAHRYWMSKGKTYSDDILETYRIEG